MDSDPETNVRYLLLLLGMVLLSAGTASACRLFNLEGYTMGSNPSPPGTLFNGRGLVTALYPPFVSNFQVNEYTWVLNGLVSNGSTLSDSVYTTSYSTNGATFTIWEDPSQDAQPTFYQCPSDINGLDPRYENSCPGCGYYLRGHLVTSQAKFSIQGPSYGQGTFTATVNWDSGNHLNDLSPGYRANWTFGGTTVSQYACMPTTGDPVYGPYQQAMEGMIFNPGSTKVRQTTWGSLRRVFH